MMLAIESNRLVEHDRDAEVDPRQANRTGKVLEGVVLIAPGIAHENMPGSGEQHLVETEVLTVAAVTGRIAWGAGRAGPSEHLAYQWDGVLLRLVVPPGAIAARARVAQPRAQAGVEQRQKKRARGR